MRTALYLRVSTADQSTENQRLELQRIATAKGWQIVDTYEDHGLSGANDKRPQLRRMMQDATRAKFDVVMAWNVDRLGRSLQQLVTLLDELKAASVGLYLHQQAIDTTTPAGRALFGMLGIFAEFERALLIERTKAGLARARAQGKRLGRAPVSPATVAKIKANPEMTHATLARLAGCSEGLVRKVRKG
jgi:DNA invertase Pin-like site-specific DNA recombinase